MLNLISLLIYTFFLTFANAEKFSDYQNYKKTKINLKIKRISENKLNYPWGMTFLDQENLLITEKGGRLLKINTKSGEITTISHNIPIIKPSSGQGGLLDVLSHSDGNIYFTYSHDFQKITKDNNSTKKSSTSIARGKLIGNEIKDFEILFIAKPRLEINKHWGARIAIKDDYLYVGLGDRDKGMISQNPQKHPGSIIRIKIDGSIPKDNPSFKGYEEWLPEIYQIGLRNPQGITVSPFNNEIYFSQHGPMGGDNIGKVKFAGNLGWKNVAWGGKEYSGKKIGKSAYSINYDKPLISWVPSIAVGNISFYKGKAFPEWDQNLLISASKTKMLLRLNLKNDEILEEEIIIRDEKEIGRIRDFEIDTDGNIFLISDEPRSSLWKIYRN